jgi:hypothetical protein
MQMPMLDIIGIRTSYYGSNYHTLASDCQVVAVTKRVSWDVCRQNVANRVTFPRWVPDWRLVEMSQFIGEMPLRGASMAPKTEVLISFDEQKR